MSFIRREWTSADADDWHKEDWLAIIFSTVSYIALVIGTALSFLTITVGFVILALGIVSAGIMMWIIDPKLRKISSEYETAGRYPKMGDRKMNQGLAVVLGMSIAYLASFIGMIFAYLHYKKNKREDT